MSFLWFAGGLGLIFGIQISFVVSRFCILSFRFQGNTPWVAPSCTDCPGFLVLGSAPAHGFHLGLGASDYSPGLAFCFTGPWTLPGSAARSSHTTHAKTHSTCFYSTGGHTPKVGGPKDLDTERKIEKSRYPKKDISIPTTIRHENITQLIRKNSNRVTVIINNSTRTGVPTG